MAGYYGYSMSNNAVEAYSNGEKPLSKWTKTEIIEEVGCLIKNNAVTPTFSFTKLEKAPAPVVKELCLSHTSWHHTSNHYNKTDFYSFDKENLERLTDEKIERYIKDYRREQDTKKNAKSKEEKWQCNFLEWSGTRKHPKATVCTEVGVIKGNWFYRSDGSKKSINANGFEKIKKIED